MPPAKKKMAAARDGVVKSAARVLRILEFFDAERRPASARRVAAALGYPQSSTAALLRSLVASGYLACPPGSRRYLPTLRVPLLGAGWVAPRLCGMGLLPRLTQMLAEQTGAAVAIAIRNGDQVDQVLTLPPGRADMPAIAHAAPRAITSPGPGRALLSQLREDDARRLLHRLNAEAVAQRRTPLRPSDWTGELTALRASGWAAAADPLSAHVGLVCLPFMAEGTGLVVMLALPAAALTREAAAMAAIMRAVFACLLPRPARLASWSIAALTHRPDGMQPSHGLI